MGCYDQHRRPVARFNRLLWPAPQASWHALIGCYGRHRRPVARSKWDVMADTAGPPKRRSLLSNGCIAAKEVVATAPAPGPPSEMLRIRPRKPLRPKKLGMLQNDALPAKKKRRASQVFEPSHLYQGFCGASDSSSLQFAKYFFSLFMGWGGVPSVSFWPSSSS